MLLQCIKKTIKAALNRIISPTLTLHLPNSLTMAAKTTPGTTPSTPHQTKKQQNNNKPLPNSLSTKTNPKNQ